MIRYKLGELMEKRRFQLGKRITIQEIAAATGINRSTLSKILNERGYATSTDILDRLCDYFECELTDLLERVVE